MEAQSPFSWHSANGWIVLAGPPDALSEARAAALSRASDLGAVAYVSMAADLGDALMDDFAELGAPTGYLVDLEESDSNAIYERLSGAGMIVLEAGGQAAQLLRLMRGTAGHAIKAALELGALVMFEGEAAAIAGERVAVAGGAKGLCLVESAIIAPAEDSALEHAAARQVYGDSPDLVYIGLPAGSALALGPAGQIQTWGPARAVIGLGDPTRGKWTSEAEKRGRTPQLTRA